MTLTAFCLLHMELLSEFATPRWIEQGVEILRRLWVEQYQPDSATIEDSLYDIERIARRVWELRR